MGTSLTVVGRPPGAEARDCVTVSVFGKVEVEGVAAELGARRGGGVLDEEVFADGEELGGGICLEAEDESFAGDAGDFGGGVEDFDGCCAGAGRDGLEVVGAAMGDVEEDLAVVGDGDLEGAVGGGGGVGDLVHAAGHVDHGDGIAGGWLAGGAVGDGAGDGCGEGS